ncbi:hypothetical protein Dimus_028795 [Dionaea muscipula]
MNSGEVRAVESIRSTLSVGQVVWLQQLKTCSLYAVPNPFSEAEASESAQRSDELGDLNLVNLTQGISSAFFPRFRCEYMMAIFELTFLFLLVVNP